MIYMRQEYIEEALFRDASVYCVDWDADTRRKHKKEILDCVHADPTYEGEDTLGKYAGWITYVYQKHIKAPEENFLERCTTAFRFCEANYGNLFIQVGGAKLITHQSYVDRWGWHDSYTNLDSPYNSIYEVEKALNNPQNYLDTHKIVQLAAETKNEAEETESTKTLANESTVQFARKSSRYAGLMRGVSITQDTKETGKVQENAYGKVYAQ